MTPTYISLLLAIAACAPLQGQLQPHERFAITAEQVAAKLITTFAQKGVSVEADQIRLPAEVVAMEEKPALEVLSVESVGVLHGSAGAKNSAVKLGCVNGKICLPFYAVVTWPDSGGDTVTSTSHVLAATKGGPVVPVIKSGAHLTLVMERGTTHIQMTVISMETGGLHRQIKVRTPDRKQTYTAEVLDANTVKGSF